MNSAMQLSISGYLLLGRATTHSWAKHCEDGSPSHRAEALREGRQCDFDYSQRPNGAANFTKFLSLSRLSSSFLLPLSIFLENLNLPTCGQLLERVQHGSPQ
jgi:hypothetical protein